MVPTQVSCKLTVQVSLPSNQIRVFWGPRVPPLTRPSSKTILALTLRSVRREAVSPMARNWTYWTFNHLQIEITQQGGIRLKRGGQTPIKESTTLILLNNYSITTGIIHRSRCLMNQSFSHISLGKCKALVVRKKVDTCSNLQAIQLYSWWGYRILNKHNRQSRAKMEGLYLKKRDYNILITIALFARKELESLHLIIHFQSCRHTVASLILKLKSLRHV